MYALYISIFIKSVRKKRTKTKGPLRSETFINQFEKSPSVVSMPTPPLYPRRIHNPQRTHPPAFQTHRHRHPTSHPRPKDLETELFPVSRGSSTTTLNSLIPRFPWWSLCVWCLCDITQGQTGFPWIDAIMTQLREEGWIHHLARHAVACFLTRGDLWISWEEGMKVTHVERTHARRLWSAGFLRSPSYVYLSAVVRPFGSRARGRSP